jgi:hypothetical protein
MLISCSRINRETITTATLGGGVEWALASNWSVKAEYIYDFYVCNPTELFIFATKDLGTVSLNREFRWLTRQRQPRTSD